MTFCAKFLPQGFRIILIPIRLMTVQPYSERLWIK